MKNQTLLKMKKNKDIKDDIIINGYLVNPIAPPTETPHIETLSVEERNAQFIDDYSYLEENFDPHEDDEDVFNMDDEFLRIKHEDNIALLAFLYLTEDMLEDLNYDYDSVKEIIYEEAEQYRVLQIFELCRINEKYLSPYFFC